MSNSMSIHAYALCLYAHTNHNANTMRWKGNLYFCLDKYLVLSSIYIYVSHLGWVFPHSVNMQEKGLPQPAIIGGCSVLLRSKVTYPKYYKHLKTVLTKADLVFPSFSV